MSSARTVLTMLRIDLSFPSTSPWPKRPGLSSPEPVLLQVRTSPCEAIGHLGLVAFLWVVELGENIVEQILELDHLVINLLDRT